MLIKRIQKKTEWSPEDKARRQAVRARLAQDRPTFEEATKKGVWLPLGLYLMLKKAILQLKKSREKAGLSLSDVSRTSGIDKAALSRLENGKHANPTIETLSRYAAALGKMLHLSFKDAG